MRQVSQGATQRVYGRYETLFRIAAGGMAEVYAARVRGEAGFQKLVALKRMLPHLTDDPRFVTMFMDEGKLAANIVSPNVVSTLDLGRAEDGSLFLVMELVVGPTLSSLLRNAAKAGGPFPLDVAIELIAQAAQGLHDAHEARTPIGAPLHIVHRDVSPQNVLVGSDGRVRITDFGVARAILRRTKTSTGELKGKLGYFSPEQCADQNVDRRSDVFSLGVVAWETLTARRLFHADNPLAVLERVTRMPIPKASAVNAAVPLAVAEVVERALQRDRNARYETAAEFGRALRAAAGDAVQDPNIVAATVRRYGGEELERFQRQLQESLRRPGAVEVQPQPPLDETTGPGDTDATEVSSSHIERSHEPPMISRTGASFVGLPAELVGPATAEPSSKAPYLIAATVATLVLAAGAVFGILAVTDRMAPPAPGVHALPPEPAPPIAAPPEALPAAAPRVEPDAGPAVERRGRTSGAATQRADGR